MKKFLGALIAVISVVSIAVGGVIAVKRHRSY